MSKKSPRLNTVTTGDVLQVLEQLPNEFIDITVTSPPYNKRNKSQGWLVTNEKYSNFDDHMPEDDYQKWQIDILNGLWRVTKSGGCLFYNHKLRWEDGILIHPFSWISKSKWLIRQEIIWDRSLTANMRGWRFWQVDERIYWLYKPKADHLVGDELESRHAKQSSIWRIKPAPRSDSHPAAFPIALPVRAIYSIPGDSKKVVFDPFCGTGTALVAAKLLGHHYIGVDISPDYVAISKKRLKDCAKDREAVNNETKRHVVDDPFIDRKKRGTVNWPYGPKNQPGKKITKLLAVSKTQH